MNDRTQTSEPSHGVTLPAGETGSSLFHRLLADAAARFPAALGNVRLSKSPKAFKHEYPKVLVRFEAARVASPERAAIARFMVEALHAGLTFVGPEGTTPLATYLASPHPTPVVFDHRSYAGRAGLRPGTSYGGKPYDGRALMTVADDLKRSHHMTDAAVAALGWVLDHADQTGGVLDLRGQRFVLMGAGAELAPTEMLLKGGATVLWIDVTPPKKSLLTNLDLAGKLVIPEGVGDILANPRGVKRAIEQFVAEGAGPVHLGLFAYAPGQGRELRLAAAMDAIARSLEPELVSSIAMFVSPTVPAEVQPEDVAYVATRGAALPRWQRVLQLTGVLKTPGHYQGAASSIALAIVALQGPTYQAAQYLAKMLSAEVYATQGLRFDGPPRPVTTSANVAGITNTKSLTHPLFQAGFIGAPSFSVRIFEPPTTRALATLLVLHDLLNPAAPGHASAAFESDAVETRALAARQIHGGCYTLPWSLEHTIRASAVLGLTKKPSLAVALAKMRK